MFEKPGAAFDAFLPHAEAASRAQPVWTPADGPLPSLYLSHGAPPVFDDALWLDEFLAWALSLPKPKAILIVSAHWEQAPLMLSATAANTPLVYDFGGFAPRYYQMEYARPTRSTSRTRWSPRSRRRRRSTSTPDAAWTTAPGCP